MIALRVTMRAVQAQGIPIDEHGQPTGPLRDVQILIPEGLEGCSNVVLTETPRKDAEQVVFVPADAVAEEDPRRLEPADVPVRDDLPVGHPLHGKRALRVVPAGWPDCTVDAKGRLVPIDLETGEPLAVGELEEREVGHGP